MHMEISSLGMRVLVEEDLQVSSNYQTALDRRLGLVIGELFSLDAE